MSRDQDVRRRRGRTVGAAILAALTLVGLVGVGTADATDQHGGDRESVARSVLARPPFAPRDPSLFSPQTYGAPPTPPAVLPQSEDRVRAAVQRTLAARFGHKSERYHKAVKVLDDPKLKANAPDIRLRGAIAVLAGTHAEDAIRVYREGTFVTVRFGIIPNPDAIAFSTREPGQSKRTIIVNQIYANEDIRLLSATLAHEALHSDNSSSSAKEELVANATDTVVLGQFIVEDPSLARQRTELSRRRNTALLALVNTRDERGFIRIVESRGNVYPGSLTPLASFAGGFGDYPAAPDTPGSEYVNRAVKSTTGVRAHVGFDLSTIDLLDRKIDRAMPAEHWLRVAIALNLRLDSHQS